MKNNFDDQELRRKCKEFRAALPGDVSMERLAAMMKLSRNAINGYENTKGPSGNALALYVNFAIEFGLMDLAAYFREVLREDAREIIEALDEEVIDADTGKQIMPRKVARIGSVDLEVPRSMVELVQYIIDTIRNPNDTTIRYAIGIIEEGLKQKKSAESAAHPEKKANGSEK